ncbi:hypothetical protein QTO34_012652 [Cnephaeus nilssonii]|uniref:Alpha/beta hydrolase domain-containing protein 17C n=1 Tax=Cnephaeus nilssonii TaxID=3371016 RepID=A0AA40HAN0_CNENI|nr:hypothetical protein QTO34_012652 [Eptesicus nilssonii]
MATGEAGCRAHAGPPAFRCLGDPVGGRGGNSHDPRPHDPPLPGQRPRKRRPERSRPFPRSPSHCSAGFPRASVPHRTWGSGKGTPGGGQRGATSSPEATRSPSRGRPGIPPAAGSQAGRARARSASRGGAAARSPEVAGGGGGRAEGARGNGAPPPWPPALCAARGPGPSTPPPGGGSGAGASADPPRPAPPRPPAPPPSARSPRPRARLAPARLPGRRGPSRPDARARPQDERLLAGRAVLALLLPALPEPHRRQAGLPAARAHLHGAGARAARWPGPGRLGHSVPAAPAAPAPAPAPVPAHAATPIPAASPAAAEEGAGACSLHLSERADWQYSQRELDAVEVFFSRTARDNRLGCMFVRCAPAGRYTLLFSHGNAVDLGQMCSFYIGLGSRINCNIFSYDYSGYGVSSGRPSEQNLYADIDAAWQALRTR